MKIDELIHKFFLGKESKEELEILNAWKEESKENLAAINLLENHWKNFEQLKDYKDFGPANAWNLFETKIEEPKVKGINYFKYIPLAAGLILLFGVLFFFNNQNVPVVESTSLVASSEILNSQLIDGSDIWLNKNSEINHSSFNQENRYLELVQGEAYFKVASDKEHPFTIKAGDFNIEVVGTEFNLTFLNNSLELYVTEGRVLVTNGLKKVYLSAGEIITGASGNFGKHANPNINISSWKTRTLVFKHSSLSDVANDLSRHFNVDLQIDEDLNTSKCFLNSSFKNESLEEVLKELQAVFGIQTHKEGNTIVIDTVNC